LKQEADSAPLLQPARGMSGTRSIQLWGFHQGRHELRCLEEFADERVTVVILYNGTRLITACFADLDAALAWATDAEQLWWQWSCHFHRSVERPADRRSATTGSLVH
jgi:hypothetical protein